jgi:hypothetical protein
VSDTYAVRRVAHALPDLAIAAFLSVGVFVVHPLSYVLHHPFWLDEAWVATLTAAPLSRGVSLLASTPVGWLILLRWMPGGRGEQLRLIPLLFAAASVAAAYVLARMLPWGSKWFARVAGGAVGLAVLLAPASLLRNDLKQYTADAFLSLMVLVLASRAEGAPDARAITELAAFSIVATWFSTATAFVVVAVFAGLFCAAVSSGSRARVRSVAIRAACVAVALVGYFALFVVPHTDAPALRGFWNGYYLPISFRALSDSWELFDDVAPALGVSAVLAVALLVAGCVVLTRLGRPGLAAAVALLWIEMMIVSMARRYPFLDLRTSHFLLIVSLATMVIGFLGIVRFLGSRWRLPVTVLALVVVGAYLNANGIYIRTRSLPREDARRAAVYVARHRHPGDIVVVTLPSTYGFSYYWPHADIHFVDDDAVSTGFVTRVRGLRDVVYADGVTAKDATRALQRALRALHRHESMGRIWIVRSHLLRPEAAAWQRAFRSFRLHPRTMQVGTEPMWVISEAAG